MDFDIAVETEPFELVDDALEWVCACLWMERMEEMEDEVDLRPRSPDPRRIVERGVRGDGERDCRLYDLEDGTRGTGVERGL